MWHFNHFNIFQSFPFGRLHAARSAHLACLAHGQNVQPWSTAELNGSQRHPLKISYLNVLMSWCLDCILFAGHSSFLAKFQRALWTWEVMVWATTVPTQKDFASDLSVRGQMVVPSCIAPCSKLNQIQPMFSQYLARPWGVNLCIAGIIVTTCIEKDTAMLRT